MAAPKLSSQDRKDLDKFAKYLVYKCIQIIVQSRLGEKVKTPSKPFSSGSDWFNLAIDELPEVLNETKKVFSVGSLGVGQKVCVEISLKTAEGETMILETWWLAMNDSCDPGARVSYAVYNRMGILLKSLFSLSRVTPAYRLARRQGPETFVICYRIYLGEPQFGLLGCDHQEAKAGAVPTPVGTITLSVAYRTTMLISPHQSTRDLSVDLKDDHFNSDSSPKRNTVAKPCHTLQRDHRNGMAMEENGMIFGELQDVCATTFSTSPTDYDGHSPGSHPTELRHKLRKPSADNDRGDDNNREHMHKFGSDKHLSLSQGQHYGAFAPYRQVNNGQKDSGGSGEEEDEEDEVPFGNLLLYQPAVIPTTDANANQKPCCGDPECSAPANMHNGYTCCSSNVSRSTGSTHSLTSAPDDFVMVELKTPFAGPEGNSDLGRFYKDCQVAPPLAMFHEDLSLEDTMNSVKNQLATFEASAKDYDDFVNSIMAAAADG